MKKFYSCVLLCLLTLAASAEATHWCLVLTADDSSTLTIAMSDKPVIKPTATGYEVTYGEGQSATFGWTGLSTITTSEVSTGVEDLEAQPEVNLQNGDVRVDGVKAGSAIIVYNLAGNVVKKTVAGANGSAVISISELPSGAIYVVKTPTTSIKISK